MEICEKTNQIFVVVVQNSNIVEEGNIRSVYGNRSTA